MKPVKNRFFFYTLAIPAFVAMVVNFSIASNLGWTPIDVEWRRTDDEVAGINRQIWYVRYIGWFLMANTHRGHSFDLCCPDPIHSVDLLPHCLDGCPRNRWCSGSLRL